MRKSVLLLLSMLTVFCFSALPLYAIMPCEGTNIVTGAKVTGECDEYEFSGTNTLTNNYVAGDCTDGGDFDAVENKTNEEVRGRCDGED